MRRRRKYTWLPILGSPRVTIDEPIQTAYVTQGRLTINIPTANQFPSGFVIPILGDEGEEEESGTEAPQYMNDALGQEYIIERIVGTLYAACEQRVDSYTAYTVTAGLFVAPKDTLNSNLALGDGPTAPYSTMWRVNCDQPWMYRQTWIVGNLASTVYPAPPGLFQPTNNESSVTPVVDVRSVRRVHKDERLWLAVFAMPTFEEQAANPGVTTEGAVHVFYDLRALGAMRRAKNTSTFRA